MKKIFLLANVIFISTVTLSACDFKPLYAKNENNRGGEGSEGSTGGNNCFTVSDPEFSEPGKILRYELKDILNNSCNGKNYHIEISMADEKQSIAIQKDREVTRYNIKLITNFSLYEKGKKEPLFKGKRQLTGGFDAVISDYGTYSQERDTLRNLATEMARELALKIKSITVN